MSAVIREVWEEGGVEAAFDGLLGGIRELPEPQDGGVALVYLCKHAGGDLVPRDRETDAARYYTQRALDALSEAVEPWSNWLVRRHFAGALTITHRDQTNPLQAHVPADNNRLQRTAERHHVRTASASFHYALAVRSKRYRAAAEPDR